MILPCVRSRGGRPCTCDGRPVVAPGEPPVDAPRSSRAVTPGLAKASTVGSSDSSDYGQAAAPPVRIVDPDPSRESPAGTVGEIWVHGENVWGHRHKPTETESSFGAWLAIRHPKPPRDPGCARGISASYRMANCSSSVASRTLLIVTGAITTPTTSRGRSKRSPEDGWPLISVPNDRTEQLTTIVEFKRRNETDEEFTQRLRSVKREVTSAISMIPLARGRPRVRGTGLTTNHDEWQDPAFVLLQRQRRTSSNCRTLRR